jgi:3-oxoacyl-[acyl-carrier-protein] synthase-3
MRAAIRDIASALPEQVVGNARLHAEHPAWNFAALADKSGVEQRHIAAADQTSLDLGEQACCELFAQHPELADRIDLLIFCTQTPDHVLPPNSCLLHHRLGLAERVAAFDLSHACSGFVYALSVAHAHIAAGMARHVLIVNADTYSKLIHSGDRSARALFGDGATATWVEATGQDRGVVDVECGTAGALFDKFLVPAGGCRLPRSQATAVELADASGNVRTAEHIHMSGRDILAFVNRKIPAHVDAILARNQLTHDDIDVFVFHQASAMVLDSLTRALRLPPAKEFRNLDRVGNLVSASIPLALAEIRAAGRLAPPATALLCGFGAGVSWGTAIVRF